MPSPKSKRANERAASKRRPGEKKDQQINLPPVAGRVGRARRAALRAFSLSSLKPKVLTKPEIEQGWALEAAYNVLAGRYMSLTHDALVDDWKSAAEAYQSNPSDATFAVMKEAALNKSFFCAETRARSQCKSAMGVFLARNVVSWAIRIVDRNLAAAAVALRKVHAVENRRCVKLTGQPLTRSDIVAVAERPVRQLERIKSRLETPVSGMLPSVDRLLRMFDAVGSDRFEDLIAPEFTPEQIATAVEEEEKARAIEDEPLAASDEGEFPSLPATGETESSKAATGPVDGPSL